MKEYPIDIKVEMLIEHFEINTIENEYFRMRTLENMITHGGLFDDIPLLAREIERQRGKILLEPMRMFNSVAVDKMEKLIGPY